MDAAFETLRAADPGDAGALRRAGIRRARRTPTACTAPRSAPRRSTRCAACCRPPRSRTSGIYGTGQALRGAAAAHARPSARGSPRLRGRDARRSCARSSRRSSTRVDVPDRGGRWSEYLAGHARGNARRCGERSATSPEPPAREVTLTDFDPDGEIKVVAAALYAGSDLPDDQLLAIARRMTAPERAARAARGDRRAREPPPSPGPRVRADGLSLRRADRLRRIPRPAAAPAADARLAGLHAAARLQRARRRSAKRARWRDWRRVVDASAELYDAIAVGRMEGGGAPTPSRWRTACASTWT